MTTTPVYSSPGKFRQLRPHLMALVLYGFLAGGIYFWLAGQASETQAHRKAAIPRLDVKITRAKEDAEQAAASQEESHQETPAMPVFQIPEGMIRIAIVVTDMGLSDKATEQAVLKLPPEITLSFSAYSDRLSFWVEQSRNARHETLLSIPMEPQTFPKDDPGPKALMARNSAEENMETLHEIMDRAQGYTGFSNFMGSRFMADEKKLRPFLQYLKDIGMLFLDTTPGTASTAALETVSETKVPFLKSDITLDDVPTDVSIRENLRKLETIAARQGYAVGLASGYPVTFAALLEWLPTLKSKNIVLTPVSAVAAHAREQQEKQNPQPNEQEENDAPATENP